MYSHFCPYKAKSPPISFYRKRLLGDFIVVSNSGFVNAKHYTFLFFHTQTVADPEFSTNVLLFIHHPVALFLETIQCVDFIWCQFFPSELCSLEDLHRTAISALRNLRKMLSDRVKKLFGTCHFLCPYSCNSRQFTECIYIIFRNFSVFHFFLSRRICTRIARYNSRSRYKKNPPYRITSTIFASKPGRSLSSSGSSFFEEPLPVPSAACNPSSCREVPT